MPAAVPGPSLADGRPVVIACDSFKGTATAADVATALAAGWASVRPLDSLRLLPMADGGEGTLDAFELAVPGARRMPVVVCGPGTVGPCAAAGSGAAVGPGAAAGPGAAGRRAAGRAAGPSEVGPGAAVQDDTRFDDLARSGCVQAHWLLLPDGTGVVELANTSGITLLPELLPFDAHTYGFGQAIAAALAHGVTRLVLAIGGSASTDGGVPVLTALGGVFRDARGGDIRPGNRGLHDLAHADLSGLMRLPPGGAQILCDVTNPLLGESGAAAVYGPQKGASAKQVAELEAGLARLAGLPTFAAVDPGAPGAGAAGGVGFGLMAWGAELTPGAAAIADVLGVRAAVAEASVVITGEGRFDSQSLSGKVVGTLVSVATDASVPIMLVAGDIAVEPHRFAATESLTALAGSAEAAMRDPLRWLREAGVRLAEAFGSAG